MAKAEHLNILIRHMDMDTVGSIGALLREEHGAHGLRFVDESSQATEEVHLQLERDLTAGEILLKYAVGDGEQIQERISEERTSIERAISRFAINKLFIPAKEQTSRSDFTELEKYAGERPALEVDPSTWIASNPFVADLTRRHAKYGNLIRYLCNERGLFLKVGNMPNQRAYWNSSLNGGLPVYKKADPVHEGTFMLHDLLHFIPVDPLIGRDNLNPEHKSAYIAHRLLSEACTLVLADMVAVSDARLGNAGYDVSKRKIYPVYQSIIENTGGQPDTDKLLAANAYFCFTGDPSGFKAIGATEEAVTAFRSKYESVFRDDFMWNLHNYEAMVRERDSNPRILEYYDWLEENTYFKTLKSFDEVIGSDGEGLDIAKLLSLFRADFKTAFGYQSSLDDDKRTILAYQKYLAGQRITFARFGNLVNPNGFQGVFDQAFNDLKLASSATDAEVAAQEANSAVDNYIDRLAEAGILLPHEEALYRFSAPLYPIKFVNYERNKDIVLGNLADAMRNFLSINAKQLRRVLETATA